MRDRQGAGKHLLCNESLSRKSGTRYLGDRESGQDRSLWFSIVKAVEIIDLQVAILTKPTAGVCRDRTVPT